MRKHKKTKSSHVLHFHMAKDTVPRTYINIRPAVGANVAIFLGFTVCLEFT
jgi:hypothetical protein